MWGEPTYLTPTVHTPHMEPLYDKYMSDFLAKKIGEESPYPRLKVHEGQVILAHSVTPTQHVYLDEKIPPFDENSPFPFGSSSSTDRLRVGDSLPETVPVYSVGGMTVHGDPLQALAPESYCSWIDMGGQVTAQSVGGGRECTFSTQGLRGFGPGSSQDPPGVMSEQMGGVPIRIPLMVGGKLRFWEDGSGRVEQLDFIQGRPTWVLLPPAEAEFRQKSRFPQNLPQYEPPENSQKWAQSYPAVFPAPTLQLAVPPAESIAVYGAGLGVRGVATPDMVGHHGEHLGVGWHSPQELPLEAAADPYRVTFGAQPRGLGNSEGQVTTDPPSLSSEATPTTQGRPSLWAETPSQVGDIPSLALSQDPGGPWLDPPAPVSSSTNENQYNRRGDLCIRERKDVF